MLASFRQLLMSPVMGPVATAVALVLAVALGVAANGWEAREARYEARIAQLRQSAEQSEQALRTQLASCHAVGAARQLTETADAGTAARASANGASAPAGARRLLETQPEGIDACARMESADRAVLQNLKK